MHGDDDQIVPIGASALLSSKLVKDATLKVYPGAPHGMCTTHKDEVNADLLASSKLRHLRKEAGRRSVVLPVVTTVSDRVQTDVRLWADFRH